MTWSDDLVILIGILVALISLELDIVPVNSMHSEENSREEADIIYIKKNKADGSKFTTETTDTGKKQILKMSQQVLWFSPCGRRVLCNSTFLINEI